MNASDFAFWTQVEVGDVRDCWRWTGAFQNSYGLFSFDGDYCSAHRYAWIFGYGPIPPGAMILHSCDRSWCVNPRHLRLGTQDENNLDRTVLGRVRAVLAGPGAGGSTRGTSDESVVPPNLGAAIRRFRYGAGLNQRDFGVLVGASAAAVCGWEKGTHGMTMARMAKIAKALGTTVAELVA